MHQRPVPDVFSTPTTHLDTGLTREQHLAVVAATTMSCDCKPQAHEAAEAEACKQQRAFRKESAELRATLAAAQEQGRHQGRLLADVTNLAAAQKAQLKVVIALCHEARTRHDMYGLAVSCVFCSCM